MRNSQLSPAVFLVYSVAALAGAQAQLTINYDYTPGLTVPDNGQLVQVQTLGGLAGLTSFDSVIARLNLTTGNSMNPMSLGDLYSSLTFGTSSETQRIAVLLNRPGRDDSDPDGSELGSLNVTFDSAVATNIFATTSSTGTYKADGRLDVNPASSGVAFEDGSNGMGALAGTPLPSHRVSLVVADYSQGGVATLSGWGVSVTGTAASTGTFTPGANAFVSDPSSGAVNTVGAILDTTGAAAGGLVVNLAGTTTFSNGVTGSGGLLKSGTGKLILEGTSNFTGTTTINNGILAVNGSTGPESAVTVNSGGTLAGSGTIGGAVSVKSGGKVGPGNSPGVLTTGATDLESGSIFSWDIAATETSGRGADYDGQNTSSLTGSGAIFQIVLQGADTFASTFWDTAHTWSDIFKSADGSTIITNWASIFSGGFDYVNSSGGPLDPTGQGSFGVSGNTLSWTAVPEPTSALAGILIAVGLFRRRRVA